MENWYVRLDGSDLPDRLEVGGKAWSLARMRQLGLPTPPAFVLPTEVCREYHRSGKELPEEAMAAVRRGIAYLEEETGRGFGARRRPLLVSVRSGSSISMPGMMDTVLNLGINDDVEAGLIKDGAPVELAADTHRRFLAGFGDIVRKADLPDSMAPAADLRAEIRRATGRAVPSDPWEQLIEAVCAVLESWYSRRAVTYRRHADIPEDLGTAVTIQAMVFGNMSNDSGTGVLFSRDPVTGVREPYGEYLPGGQGEDVVSGVLDPLPLSELKAQQPEIHRQLIEAAELLEQSNGDVQDIEFTVESGRLYLLQSRAAKRSPEAAVRLAVALADEGLISRPEALARVTPAQVTQMVRPQVDVRSAEESTVLATGEAASPGVGVGVAVSDPEEVVRLAEQGSDVVFVARHTSPEDVGAMIAARAVCTEVGGSTSHAAVVCRGLGLPAVVGAGEGAIAAIAGKIVTVDGTHGRVHSGALSLVAADDDPALATLGRWAAKLAGIEVSSTATGEVLDLDSAGVLDPAEVAAAVADAKVVSGAVLATEAGMGAALAAGIRDFVSTEPLPLLLAAVAARRGVTRDVPK